MFRSIAGDNIGADVQAMLADDYSFEVDNIFNQMNQHNAANIIRRSIARVARSNRRSHARYWPRLSRTNRRYRESGITRKVRKFL